MPSHTASAHGAHLTLRHATWSPAGETVLADIDLSLHASTRAAVVGPNGAGKTSLLRLLAEEIEPTSGILTRRPTSSTVGLVRQELDRLAHRTVREFVAAGTGVAAAESELDRTLHALADGDPAAADDYDVALTRWTALGAADFDARLSATADDLGLAARLLDADPATLSGGEAARVGLAVVELSRFDFTLLDEPTNDLDLQGLARLEEWVHDHRGGLVFVSHDRAFLERCASEVIELDGHHRTATTFAGGWQAYLDERQHQHGLAVEAHQHYVGERDHLKAVAQQKREWVMRGASRVKKNPDPDKHRNAFDKAQTEKLAGKASAADRALSRLEVVEKPWEGWDLQFTIATAQRSGQVVATLDQAVVELGQFALGPVDLAVWFGDRIGVFGANGAGKSTLIDVMLGRLATSSGSAQPGAGVVVGELGQARDAFDHPQASLIEVVTMPSGDLDEAVITIEEARSVLAKFGLDADAVDRSAQTLSPGERTRAQLAMFQLSGVNLLVLDEPTNHLDLPAIEQLEQALESYDGTLIVISHDRRFLDNVRLSRHIRLVDGLLTEELVD